MGKDKGMMLEIEPLPFSMGEDSDCNQVFLFTYKSETKEDPFLDKVYRCEIIIDPLNDNTLAGVNCSCKGFSLGHKECKHIRTSKEIIKKFINYKENDSHNSTPLR